MGKFGAYKIITERQLVIEYYRGELIIDDLIYLKKAIVKNPSYTKTWNTIFDFRDCNLSIKSTDISKLVEHMKMTYTETNTRKLALLSTKPNEVALSTLYTILLQESGLNFKTFIVSEIETIINRFCNCHLTEKEVVEFIHQLKSNSPNIFQ